MFILKLNDGSTIQDENLSWDDVELQDEQHITAAQLTLPFQAQRRMPDGTFEKLPPRTITVTGYNRWYYYREAVAGVAAYDGNVPRFGSPEDVAEVIGGIDDRNGICYQVRVATDGNIKTNRFPLSQLTQTDNSFRSGLPLKK